MTMYTQTATGANMDIGIILFIFLISFFRQVEYSLQDCQDVCEYSNEYKQAQCESRSLTTIPTECSEALFLFMRYNNIEGIQPGTFSTFTQLTRVDLSHNRITELKADTFAGAENLESIQLRYNNINIISRNALHGIGRLRSISLSRNLIKQINNETFQTTPDLNLLDLHNNTISSLSSGVFDGLRRLERLFLGMNKLTALPKGIFTDLVSLKYMDLSNNTLTEIASGLFSTLGQLATLDLSNNQLVIIDGVFQLTGLQSLDLRWNNLTGFDLAATSGTLEIVYLEDNHWICCDKLESVRLILWEANRQGLNELILDNPVCHSPSEYANQPISSIETSFENTCSSKEESNLLGELVEQAGSRGDGQSSDKPSGKAAILSANTISVMLNAVLLLMVGTNISIPF